MEQKDCPIIKKLDWSQSIFKQFVPHGKCPECGGYHYTAMLEARRLTELEMGE